MSPHDVSPTSRKTEIDLSAILVPPQPIGPGQVTHTPKCAVLRGQTGTKADSHGIWIGAFGWASINFVLGSCLIALFCTLFVSENVQHFRRRAHFPEDVAYSKPDARSATSENFSLDPSQVVSNMQLNHSQATLLDGREADSQSFLSSPPPSRQGPTSSLSPNLGRLADNGSVNNSSSARSSNGTQNGASRATTSTSASSSSGQRSNPARSTATRLAGRSNKQTLSAQRASLNSRQTLRRPWTKTAVKSANETTSKVGNQPLHRGLETKAPDGRSQMSMHAMGQGGVASQIHGTMNPMRMEGGMLAQPGIGGVAGNGLGGNSQRGGHVRR